MLGNHDYYHGWIGEVREQVAALCAAAAAAALSFDAPDAIGLTPGVGLVGHDGWADARLGDYEKSVVSMQDFRLIGDFRRPGQSRAAAQAACLGGRGGRSCPPRLARRPWSGSTQVVLLTHVPPLREACWHEGQTSDDDWAPFFTCRAVGDAILEIMPHYPQRRLTVLCGHTHGAGVCQPLANVEILTGGAEYGRPAVARIFEWD